MPMMYSEILNYWATNRCSGGNKGFPYWFWKGKKVLEIGAGNSDDYAKFVVAGAIYSGIDLAVERLPFIKLGNAEFLDFPDNYFDLVYSFGVIHHTLNPDKALKEAYRVLKPEGHLFLMLYNKFSWRYLVEIKILRRMLWLFYHPKFNEIREKIPHPTKAEWVSINTDTIGCPLSRVYTKKDVEKLLSDFTITSTWTENWGWFRMICAKKRGSNAEWLDDKSGV
jgi:SAM-dependent methyltransferase